jgi:hypothetical protein
MAPKLTFGTSIADWQERINVERMNCERAEKARNALRSHNVPALLVTKNGAELLDHWPREEILVAPPPGAKAKSACQ